MLTKLLTEERLQELLAAIEALPRPVLTIWVRTDQPAGGPGDAARLRLRQAIDELALVEDERMGELRERMLDALGRPASAHTALLCASLDDPGLIGVELATALPIGSSSLLAEAHIGAPWLLPLRLAMSESARTGVVHVHGQGVELYEVFMGRIEHVKRFEPPTLPGSFDALESSKPVHPAHIADRGGASHDDAAAHREAWRRRFLRDVALELPVEFARRRVESLIVMGTPAGRQVFEELMPAALRTKLIGVAPGLPQRDAGPTQLLDKIAPIIDEYVRRRRVAHMHDVLAGGVLGLSSCLTHLQRGQLERVFVPWDLDVAVYVESSSGRVAATPGQARALIASADTTIELADAREQLVALADQSGCSVEFTRAGASDSPFDEIQGIAGLLRWTETTRETGS